MIKAKDSAKESLIHGTMQSDGRYYAHHSDTCLICRMEEQAFGLTTYPCTDLCSETTQDMDDLFYDTVCDVAVNGRRRCRSMPLPCTTVPNADLDHSDPTLIQVPPNSPVDPTIIEASPTYPEILPALIQQQQIQKPHFQGQLHQPRFRAWTDPSANNGPLFQPVTDQSVNMKQDQDISASGSDLFDDDLECYDSDSEEDVLQAWRLDVSCEQAYADSLATLSNQSPSRLPHYADDKDKESDIESMSSYYDEDSDEGMGQQLAFEGLCLNPIVPGAVTPPCSDPLEPHPVKMPSKLAPKSPQQQESGRKRSLSTTKSTDLSMASIAKRRPAKPAKRRSCFLDGTPFECSNPHCKAKESPTWRFLKKDLFREHPYCNSCKLYFDKHGKHRSQAFIMNSALRNHRNPSSLMGRECTNCHTKTTSTWRFWKDILLCNQCGQYVHRHGRHRPSSLFK